MKKMCISELIKKPDLTVSPKSGDVSELLGELLKNTHYQAAYQRFSDRQA